MSALSELYQQRDQLRKQLKAVKAEIKVKEKQATDKKQPIYNLASCILGGMQVKPNLIIAFLNMHKLTSADLLCQFLYLQKGKDLYAYEEHEAALLISYINGLVQDESTLTELWSFNTAELNRLIVADHGERFVTLRLLLGLF